MNTTIDSLINLRKSNKWMIQINNKKLSMYSFDKYNLLICCYNKTLVFIDDDFMVREPIKCIQVLPIK